MMRALQDVTTRGGRALVAGRVYPARRPRADDLAELPPGLADDFRSAWIVTAPSGTVWVRADVLVEA